MSGQLSAAVAASLAEIPMLCPRCGARLVMRYSWRTTLFRANHPSTECAWEMGTWGYFPTEEALREAVDGGEAPRMAGAEAVDQINQWIGAGLMIVGRKKRDEGRANVEEGR
jgi:hypothetical protein